jgi:hypothetical protein
VSAKDYSNLNALAMGDIANEQLANMCLQQTAHSTTLRSVLQAAHDRIMHLNAMLNTAQPVERQVLHLDVGTDVTPTTPDVMAAIIDNIQKNPINVDAFKSVNRNALSDGGTPEDFGNRGFNENLIASEVGVEEAREEDVETVSVVVLTQPELTRETILETALKHGFKTRPQRGGPDDLNQYVYDFAQNIRTLSCPDHHVVAINDLPRYSVFEDEGKVVIQQQADGVYVAFDDVRSMIDQGTIGLEHSDDNGQSTEA